MEAGIYAVVGGKGGVGRTTTALNLGVALEAEGYNASVVDVDVQMPDVGVRVGCESEIGIHHVLAGEASINDVVHEGPAGLAVAVGSAHLADVADANVENLRRVVEPMAAAHDVVLLDLGPGLESVHRHALEAADGALLVTTPATGALAATTRTRQFVDHVGTDVVGVTVTRAGPASLDRVHDALEADVLGVVPEDDRLAAASVVVGSDRPTGEAYEAIASALATYAETGSIPEDATPAGHPRESRSAVATDERAEDAQAAGSADPEDDRGSTVVDSGGAAATLDRLKHDVGTLTDRVGAQMRPDDGSNGGGATGRGPETRGIDGDEDPLEVLFTDEYGDLTDDGRFAGHLDRVRTSVRSARQVDVRGALENRSAGRTGEPAIPDDEDALEFLLSRDE